MTALDSRVQTIVSSPLGDLRLVASPDGLAGLWFVEGQRHEPTAERLAAWPTVSSHPVLDAAVQQLDGYFRGQRQGFDLPLDLGQGTAFQQAVWRALMKIPAGTTTSYGVLAADLGRPLAVRAVGAAVGRNPLCVVVPCHRVVGSNGSLTGYAGGLDRKHALLRLEGALIDKAHQWAK
ncbi:methylated-DNA--[protein]-cysteine S-methyltransferase [Hydrogenophaga pseudoflava]|uniref:methylated-DNA--[protein]-cysteine S-methyltransferase n=1 Tax=Hydrogenophaga pseudoflava TaxID=47421 RepID=UPI0027E3DD84|nr:methylated-DNA--[protein]-cysteine S-methyltransferase [Hydrogenophaga pseudoflava]MDQ7745474.1 methylated-DNA--[protein]-cysteine S-methyltransferase [Hydrogenophaga pseudoflava]